MMILLQESNTTSETIDPNDNVVNRVKGLPMSNHNVNFIYVIFNYHIQRVEGWI